MGAMLIFRPCSSPTDMEVAGQLINNEEDRRWRQTVVEEMEERIRKRESEVGYFNQVRGRESRVCHACGKKGYIRKDCGTGRKDRKQRERDI